MTTTPRTIIREIPNGPRQGDYRVWCSCKYRSEPMIKVIAETAQRAHEANHWNYPDLDLSRTTR